MDRPMNALSFSRAQSCENAKEKVCRCRCGGALHGKKRGDVRDLPFDDPHSPSTECRKCWGKKVVPYLYKQTQTCPRCNGVGKELVASAKKKE